jgi:L-ascorbate metabolism protein UlaG (beta-lactamase superfamily)
MNEQGPVYGERPRLIWLSTTLVVLALFLIGCGGQAGAPDATSPPPAASALPAASGTADDGVTLRYEGNAQTELQAGGGPRVLIDVYAPDWLSASPAADDVLLTTHTHDDHYVPTFVDDFPGKQLFVCSGRLTADGVKVLGIAAAHSQGDPIKARGGSDYIYVVDIGGLRVAHFGDLGQDRLTSEQLERLGSVDVAVMQLSNSFSQMDLVNKKGFKLMEQVKPRLIVPTHSDAEATKYAAELWPVVFTERDGVTLRAGDLPAETTLLLMGGDARYYGEAAGGSEIDW